MATTTTPKSSTVTNPSSNSSQTGRTKEDVPTLRNKVAELERQVNEYKTKLDGLRRAKATTVLKFEKEYVNTTIPGLNRPEKSKSCEKCEEYEQIIESERKSNSELKKLVEKKENNHQKSPTKTTTNNSGPCSNCEDYKQLLEIEKENNLQLKQQIETQEKQTEEEKNAKEALQRKFKMFHSEYLKEKHSLDALKKENQDYKDASQAIKKEHEDKMADLARREEEAKKQVATWEQMYREWMATMERRVNNLQVTNQELQTCFHDDTEKSKQSRSNQ